MGSPWRRTLHTRALCKGITLIPHAQGGGTLRYPDGSEQTFDTAGEIGDALDQPDAEREQREAAIQHLLDNVSPRKQAELILKLLIVGRAAMSSEGLRADVDDPAFWRELQGIVADAESLIDDSP